MCIRWLGLYGAFHGVKSLEFELNSTRLRSAEWTVKGRRFVGFEQFVSFGLLVKSSAVKRRFYGDAGSIFHEDEGRTKVSVESKSCRNRRNFHNRIIMEAIVEPKYVGLVIVESAINYERQKLDSWFDDIINFAKEKGLKIFIIDRESSIREIKDFD